MDHVVVLVNAICGLAGDEHLIGNRNHPEIVRMREAIAGHDTPFLFERLIEAFSFQGISDHVASTYMDQHGSPTWAELERAIRRMPTCSKLRSYWTFYECGYQKAGQVCARPEIMTDCQLPRSDLRNGRLNQTAYSLFLFIRDVTGGDLVGWIDRRLEQVCFGTATHRVGRMRRALLDPLRNLFGVSDKVLNMTLAQILLSAPSGKPLWVEVGASMVAIDSLVHNWLHRTGILRRLNAQHPYGVACYDPNGCAEVVERLARRIDARSFNPNYPRMFPRFVQYAIWRYCAQLELDICNGNQIDDRERCANSGCPLFDSCDRVPLRPR